MPRAGLTPPAVAEAAGALADQRGVDGLTLAAVAARLGVATPSLYKHVDGLGALRRLVALQGLAELESAIVRASAGLSGHDALAATATAYRDFARRRPGVYRTLQRAPDPDDAEYARAATSLVGALQAALSGYGLPDTQTVHAIRAVRSALHGFVDLEAAGGFALPVDLDESFEGVVSMLDEALTAWRRGPGAQR